MYTVGLPLAFGKDGHILSLFDFKVVYGIHDFLRIDSINYMFHGNASYSITLPRLVNGAQDFLTLIIF